VIIPKQHTLTTTPIKVAPTLDIRNDFPVAVSFNVTTGGGIVRLYGEEAGADYVTFSDSDTFGPITLHTGNDEVWLRADTGTVDIQVIEVGA